MSDNAELARRGVWVLMFDRLNLADSLDGRSSSAFDALELQSTYFEQYLLQDVRDSAGLQDVLGGQASTKHFGNGLGESGMSTGVLRIICDEAVTGDQPDWRNPRVTAIRRLPAEPVDSVSLSWQADVELRKVLSSDLVWIDAEIGSGGTALAGRLLDVIQQLRKNVTQNPELQAVLIVSVVCGSDHMIAAPFMAGLCESRIHVPLWIDNGVSQACRIQSIVGSGDLLPTVTELLTGIEVDSALDQTTEMAWMAEQLPLSGASMSLVSLCNAPRDVPDRILKLTGDGWTARRTQGFLLVHHPLTANPAHQPATDAFSTSRLYLKPDDQWNVNDVSGTYAEVAEEMDRA